jgi:hypothetical protein
MPDPEDGSAIRSAFDDIEIVTALPALWVMRFAGVRREELAGHTNNTVALSNINVDAVVRRGMIGASEEVLDLGDAAVYRIGASLSVVEFAIGPKQFVEPVPLRRIRDVALQCQWLVVTTMSAGCICNFPYSVFGYRRRLPAC